MNMVSAPAGSHCSSAIPSPCRAARSHGVCPGHPRHGHLCPADDVQHNAPHRLLHGLGFRRGHHGHAVLPEHPVSAAWGAPGHHHPTPLLRVSRHPRLCDTRQCEGCHQVGKWDRLHGPAELRCLLLANAPARAPGHPPVQREQLLKALRLPQRQWEDPVLPQDMQHVPAWHCLCSPCAHCVFSPLQSWRGCGSGECGECRALLLAIRRSW